MILDEKTPQHSDLHRWRESKIQPGRKQINIDRLTRHLVISALVAYKTDFNMYKHPYIVFIGESGEDAGGMTREFFSLTLRKLAVEAVDGLPMMEGEENHIVP